jgi:hypothetical protein
MVRAGRCIVGATGKIGGEGPDPERFNGLSGAWEFPLLTHRRVEIVWTPGAQRTAPAPLSPFHPKNSSIGRAARIYVDRED